MKAYAIDHYGKDSQLKPITVPTPAIGDTEVLVQIHAAGVNVIDAKIKDGEFKQLLKYDMPQILGHDLAGTITKIGAKVTRFKVGDEVYGLPDQTKIGSFAEYIAVDQKNLALKPKNLSMEQAASVPLVGLTAWQALVERAQLKKGQKVFIQAGSGGVGTVAIQLAKHLGATVATTTSSKNTELVTKLGADIVINYKTTDFEEVLQQYDVVLHSQDSKTLEKSLRILKPGGILISISGPPDPTYAKEAGLPLPFQVIIKGLSFKTRKSAKKLSVHYSFLLMKADGDQLQRISELVESNTIVPIIDTIFEFAQTPEALQYIESGHTKGKIVIRIK